MSDELIAEAQAVLFGALDALIGACKADGKDRQGTLDYIAGVREANHTHPAVPCPVCASEEAMFDILWPREQSNG